MIMFLATLAKKFGSWRLYRASVRELQQLSDRDLEDLGILRSDIEEIAKGAFLTA